MVLGASVCVARGVGYGGNGGNRRAEVSVRRVKAQGKYELCMQKWFARVYRGKSFSFISQAKCWETYQKAWDKLVTLNTAPCSGSRWVDNGDGTVTDNLNALVWEKKTTAVGSGTDFGGDRHDVDNYYTLSTGPPYAENGTAYTDFLANLNAGGGFAGANGWRLPTFIELYTLGMHPYPCAANPCIDPVFGPTRSDQTYWSSTTQARPDFAWVIGFDNSQGAGDKVVGLPVRAVRGGL